MDTSTCVPNSQNAPQSSAQRKFYQWVLKWITGVHAHADWNNEEMRDIRHSTKPDVATLASFLQAIGFKLLSFERHDDLHASGKNDNNVETPDQGVLRVALECDISNMRAVLELGGVICKCPNSDHIKDASFWTISGTGPVGSTDNISQKIEETGSTLLPGLSKDVVRLLRDVSYKLFDIIVCEPDVNRNMDILNASQTSNTSCKTAQNNLTADIGVTRSHTEPEMFLRTDMSLKCVPEKKSRSVNSDPPASRVMSPIQSVKPVLQRQKTWDIETESLNEEPRPSLPKLTSSPSVVSELSNSLGQYSLQNEIENPRIVTEYVLGAYQNLEKALKVLLIKKPEISNDTSPIQDNDSASVRSAPAIILSPYTSTKSSTCTIIKPLSKSTNEQETRAKAYLTLTPRARRSIEPMLPKSTTRRNLKPEQENVKPTLRRSSFHIPSTANSNISLLKSSDTRQKILASKKYSTSKTNLTINSDLSNRALLTTKKVVSSEQASSNLGALNTSNTRMSMIKPPTKVSKTIPIKVKSMKSTIKMSPGILKK
ncbi:uncharacterized protein LOC126917566 isoform X2 [Bombus affinis]|uniref:uncharacterized protein LOC126917566 isoform X2 n=1 Tax=Bombus affinis TaxID=309941 RepID=UPI0021B830A2|nr:uncharacterized protein LOC126917566 isoform X2 [Bombus affinis]